MLFQLYLVTMLFCLLLLFMVNISIQLSADHSQRQIYLQRVFFTTFLMLLSDLLWNCFYLSGGETEIHLLEWVINIIYFTLSGLLGYYWLMFSETVQNSVIVRKRKYKRLAFTPVLVLIFFSITAYWNGWLFYIDSAGDYHRGPAFIIQLVCAYFMPVFSSIKALVLSFGDMRMERRYDYRLLFRFIIAPLVGEVLQIGLNVLTGSALGFTVSGIMVFLDIKSRQISIDPLTKLNNRYEFEKYLDDRISSRERTKNSLWLAILDIDKFKRINDTYGHVVGDEAIKKVADVLMEVCGKTDIFLARYGGDEFVMVYDGESKSLVYEICDELRTEFKELSKSLPYNISASFGVARYEHGMTACEFIISADAELYKIKRQLTG